MINRLLLSTAEIVIIAAVMVVIAFLCYFALRDFIPKLIASRKEKKAKKVEVKKAEEAKADEEKQKEKELNEFDKILEKVHQERIPYFAENEQVMEQPKAEPAVNQGEGASNLEIPDFDLPAFDDEEFAGAKFKPNFELNDDFDFDSDMFGDDDFGELSDDFMPPKLSPKFNVSAHKASVEPSFNSMDFVDEIRRKRKLRRNKTIKGEITSTNDRIKAIMVLDIFKTKF